VGWLATMASVRVVVEATGGLERALTHALDQAGIAVAVANPRQVRDFARATGRLAKPVRGPAERPDPGNRPARRLRAWRSEPALGRPCGPTRRPRSAADQALAAGKPKKLALTAARRKLLAVLNALLRDGTPRRAPQSA